MKILVVEDDPTVAQTLQHLLSSYHYAVDTAADGEVGLQMADAFDYDLMLLDILLPRLDGISLCQQLRASGSQIPILLLTGQGGGHQKATALNIGADDYIVKPFDAEELIARVQALLRRGGPKNQPILAWGNLSIDPSRRQVIYDTHLISVTPKEYAILELFLRNNQTVFSASAILDHVWESAESPGEEAVRVHIKEIRQKLKAAGAPKDLIKTIHRVGYRLNPLYSSFLATQREQPLTPGQIAELKSVNGELRVALEQLRSTQAELHQKNQELAIAYQTLEQEQQQLQTARDQLEGRVAERTAKLAEADHQRQQQDHQWQALFEREQLITEITDSIRQTLDLDQILHSAVDQVRQILQTDRVIIFRFQPDWKGKVVAESVSSDWTAILSTKIHDPCLGKNYTERYRQGRVTVTPDLHAANISPCYLELLNHFQVRANLVVPILQGEKLWGLLIAHHCSAPRQWETDNIQLLQQVAIQLGIALQQAELYQRTHRELQERRQIQDALQESEERFRSLSVFAPVGIYQTDIDGHFVYTNPRWQEIAGLTFEESLGAGWEQGIHPDDQKMVFTAWHQLICQKNDFSLEFRFLTPEGKERWVFGQATAIRSVTGQVIGYVGVNEDITEQKQSEIALHESEARFRQMAALLDISPDAIFVRDLDQHILYWNQGAERLYGWQAAEAIGQRANELLQNEDTQTQKILQTLLEQGEWRGELRKVTKAGQEVITEGRWTLARDETGQPKFILSVDTDVTEKKQLEAQFYQAQRLESLGRLASGIAHDLNNVLTPILTITQLLRLTQPDLDETTRERLKLVEDSAKRGADMVKQVLTFTQGSSRERTPVALAPLLQEVTSMARQSFPKSIKIRQKFSASEHPKRSLGAVAADPTHLHQVLMNLCINARDAMPHGGTLTLSAENDFVDETTAQRNWGAQVGNHVVITIADTGTGIVPEVRDRMFDPFFTTKETGQGIGLGLATVLGIVKNYGGFLQVFSEVGQGTQVKVYLPAIEAASTEDNPSSEQFNGQGELVLIVDDDNAVQQTTQTLLESHHYTTLLANDGVEAIALFTHYHNDIKLVVLDVMMPNMGGIPLIQRLKALNPIIKIIAISGLPANRAPVLAAGANAFLPKPYPIENFLRAVELAHTQS